MVKLTAKEYFMELPGIISKKAINNINKSIEHIKYNDIKEAIQLAFHWGKTNEGYDYWKEVYVNLLKGNKKFLEPKTEDERKFEALKNHKSSKENIKEELKLLLEEQRFHINNILESNIALKIVVQKIKDATDKL